MRSAGNLHDKGARDGAITVLREAIRMSPQWGHLHAELATLLEEESDYGNALGEYQEVMKLSGDSPELQTAINRVKSKLSNTNPVSLSRCPTLTSQQRRRLNCPQVSLLKNRLCHA